jgi:hypothetical protein
MADDRTEDTTRWMRAVAWIGAWALVVAARHFLST